MCSDAFADQLDGYGSDGGRGRFHHTIFVLAACTILALHEQQGAEPTDRFAEVRPSLAHIGFGCAERAEIERLATRLGDLAVKHGGIADDELGHGLSFRDPDGIACPWCLTFSNALFPRWQEAEMRLSHAQRRLCRRFGVEAMPPRRGTMIGVARARGSELLPLNAIRYPPVGQTNGGYVWRGGPIPQDENEFFSPSHVEHAVDESPQLLPYLALPPGCGVILAPAYEDVACALMPR